jgi:hypothetical protein
MLQKTDQDRLDKVLKVIEEKKLRFPVIDIAQATGFNKATVSKILKGKMPISSNFLATFNKEFPENGGKKEKVTGMVGEPLVDYGEETSISALYTIARSNESLARGNEKLAEANLKLVESNLALTSRLGQLENNPLPPKTGEFQGIPEAMLPKISDLLELIAEAGTENKWKSKDHALVELNKRFYGASGKVKEKGTVHSAGK